MRVRRRRTAALDPTSIGVARLLVSQQNSDGSWYGHNASTNQYYFETAVAIIMLNKTVFNPVPVACFTSNPTQYVANGGPVILNGGCSVEQNPANTLVSWQWDISGQANGTYTLGPAHLGGPANPKCLNASCSQIQANFSTPTPPCPALNPPAGCTNLPYSFPVEMLLTDSGGLTSTVTGNVVVANPPNPPDAKRGRSLYFLPEHQRQQSVDLRAFHSWMDLPRPTRTGARPMAVMARFQARSPHMPGTTLAPAHSLPPPVRRSMPPQHSISRLTSARPFNICLQVTNNDNLAFPTAGLGAAGLSGVASAQVTIHQPTDEACTHCVLTLNGKVKAGAPNVLATYRSTGPIQTIRHSSPSITTTSIEAPTPRSLRTLRLRVRLRIRLFRLSLLIPRRQGKRLSSSITDVVGGTTYYYRIAPATANDTETCQGNVTISVTYPKVR